MPQKAWIIIACTFGLAALFLVSHVSAKSSLADLTIDFGSPSAMLPFDRFAKMNFTITNTSSEAKTVNFTIRVLETNQEIVGWPQPQTLFFSPGETENVETFLDENWGKLDKNTLGDQSRTLIWTFMDNDTQERRTEEMKLPITVVDPKAMTGDLSVTGTVQTSAGAVAADANVVLSTGAGGYATQTITASSGAFSFNNLPIRSDWFLTAGGTSNNQPSPVANVAPNKCAPPPAPCNPPNLSSSLVTTKTTASQAEGIAYAFIDPKVKNYSLKLEPDKLVGDYSVTKTITGDIGFWKGVVDENEDKVLVIQGMENWKDESLKSKSQLQLYTLTGEQLWAYDMGWEGWGADLSRDGSYAAFTTSNSTHDLGVIDATTGQPIWTKSANAFTWPGLTAKSDVGGIDSKEIKISSTNAYVGIGHGGGDVVLADLRTGAIKWHTDLHGQVRGIAFDAADQYLYAGSGDGRAYKLNINDGSIVWQTSIGSWPFTGGFKLSNNDAYLGTASKVGEVTVIDTVTGQQLWQSDQSGNASWLDFSPDSSYIFAGGGGQGASTLYETKTGKKLWRLGIFSHQGRFAADGQSILVGDQAVQIYDLTGNIITSINTENKPGENIKQAGSGQFAYISKDGTRVIYSHRDIEAGGTSLIFATGTLAAPKDTAVEVPPSTYELAVDSKANQNSYLDLLIIGLATLAFVLGTAFMIVRMRFKHFNK